MSFGSQFHGDARAFNQKSGKRHASFFMYRTYGQPFPAEWVAYLKSIGAIPHIAWEPRSLNQVQDDDYLRSFVQAARNADWPLFIRFASEMNGKWTPYHGRPDRYRQAFRTVYQAFRAAPRAAVIWCPNSIPADGVDAYYPGDDATDWVGVNLYSVLYQDDDRARPGDHIHPASLLDPIYARYSSRKPIAICEYAASHQARNDSPRPDFAIRKMVELYRSLPARYPRVKMINWYDCNNMRWARPGRQLNDYSLTEDTAVLSAYRRCVALPYFLGSDGSPEDEVAGMV